jgi:hypothetical protein
MCGEAFLYGRVEPRWGQGAGGEVQGREVWYGRVYDRGEVYGMAVQLQLTINARVIEAERSCPENGQLPDSW